MTRPPAFRVEHLEPRDVPAGNVTASFVDYGYGPILWVEGDDLDNSVVLTSGGDNVVVMKGINTTVNGGSKAVTFTGFDSVFMNVGAGDDTVRGSGLRFRGSAPDDYMSVWVTAGEGDDTVRFTDTTAVDTQLDLAVDADAGNNPINGDDRIEFIGTTVHGRSLSLRAFADSMSFPGEVADGSDTVTISNTKLTYSSAEPGDYAGLFIQALMGEYSLTGEATDRLTVDNVSADLSADYPSAYFDVITGNSHDTVRYSNIDIRLDALASYSVDWWHSEWYDETGGYGGVDDLSLKNVNITATYPEGDGWGYTYGTFLTELADVSNVHVRTDGSILLGVTSDRADFRNVTLVSDNETATLGVNSRGDFGMPMAFESSDFRLSNVHIAGSPDLEVSSGITFYQASDSPNRTTLVNCSADLLYNYTFFAIGANGDDEMTITNCRFGDVSIDTGDGDDTVTLTNNTLGEVDLRLGDGDDTAVLKNNSAATSIAIDGGNGWDSLIAWGNIAPDFTTEDFEVEL